MLVSPWKWRTIRYYHEVRDCPGEQVGSLDTRNFVDIGPPRTVSDA